MSDTINSTEVDSIKQKIEDNFNSTANTADVTIYFETTGEFIIEVDNGTTLEDFSELLKSSLSGTLNISDSKVDIVFYNRSTGAVVYKIKSDTFEESVNINSRFNSSNILENVNTIMANSSSLNVSIKLLKII